MPRLVHRPPPTDYPPRGVPSGPGSDVARLRHRLTSEVMTYGRRRGLVGDGYAALPDRLVVRAHRATALLRALSLRATVPGWSRAEVYERAAEDVAVLSRDDAPSPAASDDPLVLPTGDAAVGTQAEWVAVEASTARVERGVVVASGRDEFVFRLGDRSLVRRQRARIVVFRTTAPSAELADLHARRAWFDRFRLAWPQLRPVAESDAVVGHPGILHWFTCPCCGYPTRRPMSSSGAGLRVQVAADPRACLVCGWSDVDGLDDLSETSRVEANGAYDLAAARRNVVADGSAFAPDDDAWLARRHRKRSVRRAKARVRALFDGMAAFDVDTIEAVDAWRGAFALLEQFDARMEEPVGQCLIGGEPRHSGVAGALGRRLDDLRASLGL